MPQRAHALRVAPIFGPRYVAKLVRSTAATTGAWLLAIFRKLTATWHTQVFQQSPRRPGADHRHSLDGTRWDQRPVTELRG